MFALSIVISTEQSEWRDLMRPLDYARGAKKAYNDKVNSPAIAGLFLFFMNIYWGTLGDIISPSLRTASSLVTDWESEPYGLKVFINWLEGDPIGKFPQV